MDKLKNFRKEINDFNNPQLKRLATLMVENADISFFALPYSATGKYISRFSRKEGGMVRHTKAVFYLMQHYCTPLLMMEEITKREADLILLASLCHSMGAWRRKFSVSDDRPEGHETVTRKMIPPLAVDYLFEIYNKYSGDLDTITLKDIEFVKRLIISSLGPWGNDKPMTYIEKLFSMAVYTSTLPKIDMRIFGSWNKTDTDILIDNLGDLRFHIGKHKGDKISFVYKADKNYLEWFAEHGDQRYFLLRKAVQIYLQNKKDEEEDGC